MTVREVYLEKGTCKPRLKSQVGVSSTKGEKEGTPNLSALRQGDILQDSRSKKKFKAEKMGEKGPKGLELYPKSNEKISKGIRQESVK